MFVSIGRQPLSLQDQSDIDDDMYKYHLTLEYSLQDMAQEQDSWISSWQAVAEHPCKLDRERQRNTPLLRRSYGMSSPNPMCPVNSRDRHSPSKQLRTNVAVLC